MVSEDSTPKPVTMTPQIETLDLPAKLKELVQLIGAQLTETDRAENTFSVKRDLAHATFLALAKGDENKATMLVNNLVAGVEDMNAMLAADPLKFPIF